MKFPFYKMNGCGNDFIIIDNRKKIIQEKELKNFIVSVCRRKLSVGANGVILVEHSLGADFKWRYFNSDGSEADMCGNGARCVARFAFINGISGKNLCFESNLGKIQAAVIGDRVKIEMPKPKDIRLDYDLEGPSLNLSSLNTGVPHVVIQVEDLENVPIIKLGKEIRFHRAFMPEGTNVNFMQFTGENTLVLRTYERGVEDETLACGTGSVACALIAACKNGMISPIKTLTRGGGYLTIHFDFDKYTEEFSNIYLEGDARIIYQGEMWNEAFG